jgi:hypothetical protein
LILKRQVALVEALRMMMGYGVSCLTGKQNEKINFLQLLLIVKGLLLLVVGETETKT